MKNAKLAKLLTKMKIFNDLLSSKITGRRKPIIANLLLTNRCNLRCFYCYVDVFHRRIPDIPTDKIFHIIDVLHKNGTKVIVLLGGEPLVRKDIGSILEYINKKGMICELITNGYSVEKWINSLKLVDSVCVSLDGDQISNDLNRGNGSFKIATDAIKLLKENNINTRIKAVMTRNNIGSLEFLANFVKENKLLMTSSVAVVYEEREYDSGSKWLNNKETQEFLKKLRDLKKNGIPIGYSFKALDYCINWPLNYNGVIEKADESSSFKYLKCRRKDFSLYMDADGTVYPCANLWGNTGKNILTDGFEAAWDNFGDYKCFCCGNIPDVDISLLLDLNFKSILRALGFFR